MALNESRRWLIAYDLRDHRRIGRVHRLLTRVALPVQYSVFAAVGNAAAMRQLAKEIEELIDGTVDDVRMYPIPAQPLVHSFGRTMLPDDAALLDARGEVQLLLGTVPAAAEGKECTTTSAAGLARVSASAKPSPRRERQNCA